MNDKLENIIRDNKELIQNDEPAEGHFERFESLLNKTLRKKRVLMKGIIWRVAAIIVFGVLITNQVMITVNNRKNANFTLGSVSNEYREVEFYYTTAINQSMNEWESLCRQGYLSDSEIELMKNEQKDFDTQYKKLIEDLKANPDDERVINAMLEYYQAKLNVMNLIISNLKQVKQQKYNDHETVL